MLLNTLGTTLLGNFLAGKSVLTTGEETIKVVKNYQNKPRLNVYSRNNLPKLKVEAYVTGALWLKQLGGSKLQG